MSDPAATRAHAVSAAPIRTWGRFALLALTLAVLLAFFALQLVAMDAVSWRMASLFTLVDWGPWLVLAPLVIWLAHRFQIDGSNWRRTVPIHIMAALGVIALLDLGTNLLMRSLPDSLFEFRPRPAMGIGGAEGEARAFYPRGPGPWMVRQRAAANNSDDPAAAGRPPGPTDNVMIRARGPGRGQLIRLRLSLPIYVMLVAGAHAFAYHRRSLDRERRALSAEAQLTAARLMALQNQLHPHFLFNTLNSISSLVYTQPKEADEMVCSLSELLRGVLAVSERPEVTLAEELQFVDRYLAIQSRRFADRLQIERAIDPGLVEAIVPTLILQPLVENAVVHGVAHRAEPGIVTVRVSRGPAGRLLLEVADTGRGAAQGTKNPDGSLTFPDGIGLGNTRARLAALYGNDARLSLRPSDEGGVLACLDLPLRFRAAT